MSEFVIGTKLRELATRQLVVLLETDLSRMIAFASVTFSKTFFRYIHGCDGYRRRSLLQSENRELKSEKLTTISAGIEIHFNLISRVVCKGYNVLVSPTGTASPQDLCPAHT
jgi:hypothetical protein